MKKIGAVGLSLFLAFGLFTSLVPCKYSSRAAVMRYVGYNLIADGGACSGDCDCNSAWADGDCPYGDGCKETEWGCGPFWILTCNACRAAGPVIQ